MTASSIPAALHFDRVGVRRQDFWLLEQCDWSLPAGQSAVVLGPNGSGKSTLLRLCAGYLFPTVGNVSILGHQLGKVPVHDLRQQLGVVDPAHYLPRQCQLPVLQVVVTGLFGHWSVDDPKAVTADQWNRAEQALEEVGLKALASRTFPTLSEGERARVLLARALVREPKLLLLDEPTAGLDLPARHHLLSRLHDLTTRRPDLTTVLITHHLDDISHRTDHVLLLREGRPVAQGTPQTVLTTTNLRHAFDAPLQIETTSTGWHWWIA